jgi:iron complex transport system permease protein
VFTVASGHRRVRPRTALVVVVVALAVAVLANGAAGAVPVPPGEVLAVLARRAGLGRFVSAPAAQHEAVIWNIRLPRLVLAGMVGSGLGTAGALLQAVFRNPLAEPSVIGVSAGAAVGAVAAIVAGVGSFGGMAVPAAAFVGALGAAGMVYATARRGGRGDAVTLVLCGIAVSVIASALTGLLTYAADDAELRNIVFWSLGSVGGATWAVVASVVIPIGLVVAAAPLLAGRLDVLSLGEREAGHVGIDVERLRLVVIAMASLATAAAVATAGIVAFVGLVAPHLVRLVVGPGHRALLPLSALAGAVLVLVSDLAARTVIAPRELPLGVVTALVGGPYLLWLVRRALDDMSGLWT